MRAQVEVKDRGEAPHCTVPSRPILPMSTCSRFWLFLVWNTKPLAVSMAMLTLPPLDAPSRSCCPRLRGRPHSGSAIRPVTQIYG